MKMFKLGLWKLRLKGLVMATITATSATANGSGVTVSSTLLDGTDDLVYSGKTKKQLLVLNNDTGGDLNVLLVGDAATAFTVQGYGEVDPSAGVTIPVLDGTTVALVLSGVDKYLTDADGSISLTGGTGATAELYNIL